MFVTEGTDKILQLHSTMVASYCNLPNYNHLTNKIRGDLWGAEGAEAPPPMPTLLKS